jgi:hypothetical protein
MSPGGHGELHDGAYDHEHDAQRHHAHTSAPVHDLKFRRLVKKFKLR